MKYRIIKNGMTRNGMTRNMMLNTSAIEKPSNNIVTRENIAINKQSAENPPKKTIPTTTGPVSGSFEIM
jgi:hypothetical protein